MAKLQKRFKNAGNLISYSTITGQWPTKETLRSLLLPLRREDVIDRLAWCNAFGRTWERVKAADRDRLLQEYILPSWKGRIDTWNERFEDGFLFSRFTLLWLMRQAFTICTPKGQRVETRKQLETLGEACLIANDLASFKELPKRLLTPLELAANLIPTVEYFSQEEYDRDIARTIDLFTRTAVSMNGSGLRDFPERVEGLLGFSITEYCDVSIACAAKPIGMESSTIESFSLEGIRAEQFRTTTISPTIVASFLTSVSADEEAFVSEFRSTTTATSDLTAFRQWPLLRREESYMPLDLGFVLDKAGRSLFWTAVKRSSDPEERKRLLDQWSQLFEVYVNDLLAEVVNEKRRFIANPRFPDNTEAFDGCILEGRTIIVVETKASTIASEVKYGDDPERLGAILEEKFIVGDESGRKGLAQLSQSIRRFTAGEPLVDSGTGDTIEARTVSKLIPVLVHLDNTLRTPGINCYMAGRFRRMFRPRNITMTPLLLLSVSELEELQGQFETFLVSEVIESFLLSLRGDPLVPFFTWKVPILAGKSRKESPSLTRFYRYLEQWQNRLFPNDGASTGDTP